MAPAKMPENVGKKIVEALKKRGLSKPAEKFEEDFIPEEELVTEEIPEETEASFDEVSEEIQDEEIVNVEDVETADDEPAEYTEPVEDEITDVVEEDGNFEDEAEAEGIIDEQSEDVISENETEFTDTEPEEEIFVENDEKAEVTYDVEKSDEDVDLGEGEIPANVAILNKLISDLPGNVSKKTGALIIKNTMEALGISLSNVISEAQGVQDTLAEQIISDKERITEHRRKIAELERNVRDYKVQSEKLNELISLFIATE